MNNRLFILLLFGGVPAALAFGIVFLAGLGAAFVYPWRNAAARRRANWVLSLAFPPTIAFLCGPMFGVHYRSGAPDWFNDLLAAEMLAEIALAAWLSVSMRGARRFASLAGASCCALTYLLALDATLANAGPL